MEPYQLFKANFQAAKQMVPILSSDCAQRDIAGSPLIIVVERIFTVQFRLVPSMPFSFHPYCEGLHYLVLYGCSSGKKIHCSFSSLIRVTRYLKRQRREWTVGKKDKWKKRRIHYLLNILSICCKRTLLTFCQGSLASWRKAAQ